MCGRRGAPDRLAEPCAWLVNCRQKNWAARPVAMKPDRAAPFTSLRRFDEVIPGRLRPRSGLRPFHLALTTCQKSPRDSTSDLDRLARRRESTPEKCPARWTSPNPL